MDLLIEFKESMWGRDIDERASDHEAGRQAVVNTVLEEPDKVRTLQGNPPMMLIRGLPTKQRNGLTLDQLNTIENKLQARIGPIETVHVQDIRGV